MKRQRHYSQNDICAVIVSYNPSEIIVENVNALLPQIGRCLIVDNGSDNPEWLEKAERKNVFIIRFDNNRGIGAALNEGLRYCYEKSYPLMLTMDQDTILNDDAVKELLRCINHTGAVSVGINWDNTIKRNRVSRYLITSGNLVKTEAAIAAGGYDEKLFIDSVDFDFSLRLAGQKGKQIKVAQAKAIHNLGEEQRETGYITHSVDRYFYIYRNHFYFCRKYWKRYPVMIAKKNVSLMIDLIRIVVYDDEKKDKLRQIRKSYSEYRKMMKESAEGR